MNVLLLLFTLFHIGFSCHTNYSGPITHFSGSQFYCEAYNGIANGSGNFVAVNYKLLTQYPMSCGPFRCVYSGINKYTIIDYCDASNCDFHVPGHIDVLVTQESGYACVAGCQGYEAFSDPWFIDWC